MAAISSSSCGLTPNLQAWCAKLTKMLADGAANSFVDAAALNTAN